MVRVREAVGGAERDELAAVHPLARSTRLQLYRVPPLQPRDPTQPRPPARQPRRRRVPSARQRDSASPSRAHGQGGAARPQGQGQGPRAHLRQGARPHEGGQAPGPSLSSSSAPRSHLAGADTSHINCAQLIEDPELEERVLSSQLKEAGLYAANILGGASLPLALSTRRARARELTPRSLARADGNCLFRALSDQLYGSPSMHQAIRQEVRTLPLSLSLPLSLPELIELTPDPRARRSATISPRIPTSTASLSTRTRSKAASTGTCARCGRTVRPALPRSARTRSRPSC